MSHHHPLLRALGLAIDTSLTDWESYTHHLRTLPSLDAVTVLDPGTPATTAKVLEYVLHTLPQRHGILVKAYGDPGLDLVVLPVDCERLLDHLQDSDEGGEWFKGFVKSKRFIGKVLRMEDEVASAEKARLQSLRRLKADWIVLKEQEMGRLDARKVEALVEAMEVVGVELVGVEGFEAFGEEGDEELVAEECRRV
ncbi:uncharacterized protein LTR77_009679 [Saxophila tyrrhenica]|uniref:Uncharacterized protein n=1 Tax=Saxophila tyrrhenica TaxID=1690608 RepID=A0AAV9NXM5_9PEZI|nr:hypothetical protein LTR77_009679 [Saxophila tyrrhenica]